MEAALLGWKVGCEMLNLAVQGSPARGGHPSSWTLTRRLKTTVLGAFTWICSLRFGFHSVLQALSLPLSLNYLFGKESITSFSCENNKRKHTITHLCLVKHESLMHSYSLSNSDDGNSKSHSTHLSLMGLTLR